ncbi:protein translocase subunit SecF [Nocardioides dongxiaopingii]|uniref:protein translocase subunit SecF n=1 Tax=Nocardioides TaxID=1839 RepID=UPI0010C76BB7|nr:MULTISPECIES: protein translocase subunit SecF [Nocardioides]QCW50960.2 protein translocase subunit SecF [Nocardioides sp. S-1144]
MGKFSRVGNDLYTGRKSYDFVHRRPLWYAITGGIVLLAFAAILFRGLNFGIEFTGGNEFRVPVSNASQVEADQAADVVAETGIEGTEAPTANTAGNAVLVQVEELTNEQAIEIRTDLAESFGVAFDDVSNSDIGASWGQEVAQRAVLGVAVFLVLVLLFIGAYFREWKMSVAALVALIHDVVITVGVYALSGFQVTPSAVTGLLAILGFSLYDTVVVFDKVRENTRDMRKNRQTYAEAANLAVNQTLVRSVNTGIVALIPIGAILWVSAAQLGASSLQDLALSQFVGMAVGVYSSVILAPRVLVHLKSNESEVKLAERRSKARERAQADRYAAVPVFTDDMPEQDGPDDDDLADVDDDLEPSTPTLTKRPEATGRGRTVPPARGPVGPSGSAGRNQPSRQSRSKRGK